jgi:hypothetical protein
MGFPAWRKGVSALLSSVERVWTRAVLGVALATAGLSASGPAQPASNNAPRVTPYAAKFVLAQQAEKPDDKDKDKKKDAKAKDDKDKKSDDKASAPRSHSSHASHSSHSSHASHSSHSSHRSAGWV